MRRNIINKGMTSNLSFRLMTISYKFRDFFQPRINILKEVGIKLGDHVLDYGCGPGSYIIPLIELVGKEGEFIFRYSSACNPNGSENYSKKSN